MTTVALVLNVEDGQFDDAPEDVGHARIDDTELIDLTSDEDEYDDDSEEYDQVRVEDEDWEIAEKGMDLDNLLVFVAYTMCRFHETI